MKERERESTLATTFQKLLPYPYPEVKASHPLQISLPGQKYCREDG